jgi:hypothetical protein
MLRALAPESHQALSRMRERILSDLNEALAGGELGCLVESIALSPVGFVRSQFLLMSLPRRWAKARETKPRHMHNARRTRCPRAEPFATRSATSLLIPLHFRPLASFVQKSIFRMRVALPLCHSSAVRLFAMSDLVNVELKECDVFPFVADKSTHLHDKDEGNSALKPIRDQASREG